MNTREYPTLQIKVKDQRFIVVLYLHIMNVSYIFPTWTPGWIFLSLSDLWYTDFTPGTINLFDLYCYYVVFCNLY